MTTKEHWLEAALTNDVLVAELLLRIKHSKSSSSMMKSLLPPPVWGRRKNRSKSTPSLATTTTAAAAVSVAVVGKDKDQQRGSPTTHLSWSGGSTSDGCYEESSRPSDLSSGGRSIKANEVASTSGYNKSHKRKVYDELKEVEGSLLKERIHINKELAWMRSNLNQQMVTSENLKRIKMDFDRNPRKTHEPESALVKQSVETSCRVEAETKEAGKGFVLPDLNMTPNEEEDVAMMS